MMKYFDDKNDEIMYDQRWKTLRNILEGMEQLQVCLQIVPATQVLVSSQLTTADCGRTVHWTVLQ